MVCRFALPPSLLNIHDVFHVSQLRKYIPYLSLVIQLEDVQVKENLIVKVSPLQIEDHKVKHLRCKEISSVKVVRGGPAGGSVTWELENQMRES